MKQFYEFVQNTEFHAMKYLGLSKDDSDRFVSQIYHDKKGMYEPNLNVKIPFQYNQFLTDLYSVALSCNSCSALASSSSDTSAPIWLIVKSDKGATFISGKTSNSNV